MFKRWISNFLNAGNVRVHVDHLYGNKSVSGWALDRKDPDRRIDLEILLDNQVAGRGIADQYRQDLKEAFGTDGHHGFTVDMDFSALSIERGKITVRESGSKRILSSNEVFCDFNWPVWDSFEKKILRGLLEEKLLDPETEELLKSKKFGTLLNYLGRKRDSQSNVSAYNLLYFSLLLFMGEETEIFSLYREFSKTNDLAFTAMNELLQDHCRSLWTEKCNESLSVREIRKIELSLTAFPYWLDQSLAINEGSMDRFLAKIIRSGYLPEETTLRKLLDLWNGVDAKRCLDEYRMIEPLGRTLHQLLLTGNKEELFSLLQELSQLLNLRKVSSEPMIKSLLLLGMDVIAFFVMQELIEEDDSREAEKILRHLSVNSLLRECEGCMKRKERILSLITRKSQGEKKRKKSSPVNVEKNIEFPTLLKDADTPIGENEITCFLVQRNEGMRLEGFFEHYRKLGVRRFYVVDNGSDDTHTLALLKRQKDVELFSTRQSYAEARYGIDWVEMLLSRYNRKGSWSLVVDADELLMLDERFDGLETLAKCLEAEQCDALGVPLLDLYGQNAIRETRYRPGLKILEECPWYDAHFYTTYSPFGGPQLQDPIFQGGVRSRTFGIDTVVLNKVPFFRYHPGIRLREGMHWVDGVRAGYGKAVLLHFKYIASFHRYVEEEAKRGEHWNGASEYKRYYKALRHHPDFSLYHPVFSRKFDTVRTFFSHYPYSWEV